MSNVLVGVLEKVQAALPDQIGNSDRWDLITVSSLILAADRATRDMCEVHFDTDEVSLTDDTVSYDVASTFISINKVEFSLDGTNYDWLIQPRSMIDLDRLSHSWRTDRSTRPDFYTLLSAPGVQSNGTDDTPSQILLYPALTSAGSAKIKLTGVSVPDIGSGLLGDMPEDVQSRCHLPYVLSVLYAVEDPKKAAGHYAEFKKGCEIVRNRFRSQYKDLPSRPGGSQHTSNSWVRT